jgi:hypothetical protein
MPTPSLLVADEAQYETAKSSRIIFQCTIISLDTKVFSRLFIMYYAAFL